MPWKEFPNGARMFVPKGNFERFQAEQFWAGCKGGLSGRAMQSLQENPTETVRVTVTGETTTHDQENRPSLG